MCERRLLMENDNILHVKTFGGFSMMWNGKNIGGTAKSGDSQFTRLMQIILHYKERGVTRIELQDLLFDDSNADDIHHLLRSVLYNARRRLKQNGLPESSYIEYRDGTYYWTSDIPVQEDARAFEELCSRGLRETDTDKRLGKLLDAIFHYEGEFLPNQTRLLWVSREDARYRRLIESCIDEAAGILKSRKDYPTLESLGRHASRVCPFSEWETLTMEALRGMGKHQEAHELFVETTSLYQNELGILPPVSVMDKMDSFEMIQPIAMPEDIMESFDEEEEEIDGGFYCTYPVFRGVYRILERSMLRFGLTSFLLVCTIVNPRGDKPMDDRMLEKVSSTMKEVICSSLRRSDIVCQYGKMQFLVILINRDISGCEVVRDRIDRNFKAVCRSAGTEYSIRPIKKVPQY